MPYIPPDFRKRLKEIDPTYDVMFSPLTNCWGLIKYVDKPSTHQLRAKAVEIKGSNVLVLRRRYWHIANFRNPETGGYWELGDHILNIVRKEHEFHNPYKHDDRLTGEGKDREFKESVDKAAAEIGKDMRDLFLPKVQVPREFG